MQAIGELETGQVGEQLIQVLKPMGQAVIWRRIRVLIASADPQRENLLFYLDQFTGSRGGRDRVAAFLKRLRMATAFQHLVQDLNPEIHSLGNPRAALFGFS